MNFEYIGKLPVPEELKKLFPVTDALRSMRADRDREIKKVLSGKSDKFILIIGPCSADNEDAVMDYVSRLRMVQERVSDKMIIIPRVYSNKPRTSGNGYMGMLHNPDPVLQPDIIGGLMKIRRMHLRIMSATGFTCADEILYPEVYEYYSDILGYAAIGARSVENQQHRLTASALDIPVGMKNPTSGDISVMLNAIAAAQKEHDFIYGGWEVKSAGNEYAHGILRGGADISGVAFPNCSLRDLSELYDDYSGRGLKNMAVIVDSNHSNSGKDCYEQINVCRDVLESRKKNPDVARMVKGLMVESYIEDGAQHPGDGVYGMSITDQCLGWEKSEKLIYEISDNF